MTPRPASPPDPLARAGSRVAVVVPTKDRPRELARLLASLAAQTVRPGQVIVVDASRVPVARTVASPPGLEVRHVRSLPPSAARQRNAGVEAVREPADLVAFLDDDVTLEPDAFAVMLRYFERAPADVAGASLNPATSDHPGHGRWKRSRLTAALGLYDVRYGRVAPSGWHCAVAPVDEDRWVQWLPTTAAWWRREVLGHHRFDPFFQGYSYLEDLDFSYGVGRRHRLAVVAAARYHHAPSPRARARPFEFGRMEVANRLFVVRKHGLSGWRCGLALLGRWLLTIAEGLGRRRPEALARAAGNVAGLLARRPPLGRSRARRALLRAGTGAA